MYQFSKFCQAVLILLLYHPYLCHSTHHVQVLYLLLNILCIKGFITSLYLVQWKLNGSHHSKIGTKFKISISCSSFISVSLKTEEFLLLFCFGHFTGVHVHRVCSPETSAGIFGVPRVLICYTGVGIYREMWPGLLWVPCTLRGAGEEGTHCLWQVGMGISSWAGVTILIISVGLVS